MFSIHTILKNYWGFDAFRPLQQQIIETVLSGGDALALLPTGGGKSLCYQVPGLAQDGLCLVISPLIALMKDQIEGLRNKGIMALGIYAGLSRRQIAQTLKNAAHGDYKFLYLSPERLETALFLEFLPALQVNLIAVDEAHCISQWGYDFRPSYLRIAALRTELPNVPLLALTASATPDVQNDICENLLLKKPARFQQSFARPNLSYSVFLTDSKQAKLVDILSKVHGSAIVYCNSRRRCTETASLLSMHGISAQFYHAGLTSDERSKRQEAWIKGDTRVMVCTNAFGMGIDKADVRLVVHADAPDSLESYYQEAGRGGRDGKKAYAVLLYTAKDSTDLEGQHTRRFPSFDEIKKVYNALVNFLQMPSYTGEDQAFSFRFETFIRQFKLDGNVALYALKALESDGWILFNEKSFLPSTLHFTTTKNGLETFFQTHPYYESLATTLLRTYGGIFDFPVSISEVTLAQLTRRSKEAIHGDLKKLAALGIISYTPQSDDPQIIFRKLRVPANELTMNWAQYNKRKEAYAVRVQKMISYLETLTCRSTFINTYFGDKTIPCGVCDNCLCLKNNSVSAEEFQTIYTTIKTTLEVQPTTATALLQALRGVQKEKAWNVIRFLQAENKLHTDSNGLLKMPDVTNS
ncbi:MAG TPA: ATP-dependent DNA helicase RecQ [Chitinophagaceae bacterium]|nr:ATP-dependent DNA helicase RecQ [Chitinophagaceae bacterium]